MRLATFNVENMFERAKAFNMDSWEEGAEILADFHRLNELIHEPSYTPAIKKELLHVLGKKPHQGLLSQGASRFICLRDIRGRLLKKPKNAPAEIEPQGRSGWIGWFELEVEPVSETATENTARIIGMLKADVLCVVEAENRICLKRFNDSVLPGVKAEPFGQVMLIDGNDDRGIDVGILARKGYRIARMRSHVDDTDKTGIIFSRDCAEYEIETEQGNTLLVMVNHFKSKGYGGAVESAKKRHRQARRVRDIYEARKKEGYKYIAIAGDLNEVPDAAPMDPLLRQGSDLTDIMTHAKFKGDGRPGTHGSGIASAKLDYILMSPKLAAKAVAGGIERRGVWGGTHGTLFPHIPEIVEEKDAASDHAALWADFAI